MGGGMGGGDMKLGAMMGAFLGWKLGLLSNTDPDLLAEWLLPVIGLGTWLC